MLAFYVWRLNLTDQCLFFLVYSLLYVTLVPFIGKYIDIGLNVPVLGKHFSLYIVLSLIIFGFNLPKILFVIGTGVPNMAYYSGQMLGEALRRNFG